MRKNQSIRKACRTMGRYVRDARLAAGLSRKRVVTSMGISRRELSDYENGITAMPLNLFAWLVHHYEADHSKAQASVQRAGNFLQTR
jgi:transcriptional regulator with XRE-family HTH domain